MLTNKFSSACFYDVWHVSAFDTLLRNLSHYPICELETSGIVYAYTGIYVCYKKPYLPLAFHCHEPFYLMPLPTLSAFPAVLSQADNIYPAF